MEKYSVCYYTENSQAQTTMWNEYFIERHKFTSQINFLSTVSIFYSVNQKRITYVPINSVSENNLSRFKYYGLFV